MRVPAGTGRGRRTGGAEGARGAGARRTLAVCLSLALLAGCATAGDMADLENTVVAEFRAMEARQDSLAREIRQLRAAMDSIMALDREALAGRGDLVRRLDRLETQLSRATALAGENQRMLAGLRERMEEGEDRPALSRTPAPGDREAERAEDAPRGMPAEADEPAPESPEEEAPAEIPALDDDVEPLSLYEAALGQFRRGSYETARSALEEFLERFPDHDLAPDAHYFVGETFVETGEPERALEAYGRVLQLFPDSRRAPRALYRSGVVELDRGNVEDARTFFSRVVRGYPESDEAELARDRLGRISG